MISGIAGVKTEVPNVLNRVKIALVQKSVVDSGLTLQSRRDPE
jgi:hypothetical protein